MSSRRTPSASPDDTVIEGELHSEPVDLVPQIEPALPRGRRINRPPIDGTRRRNEQRLQASIDHAIEISRDRFARSSGQVSSMPSSYDDEVPDVGPDQKLYSSD
jgi:hypothetical protein